MPKIRDLGINTIPNTMRPPEIGPGGGGAFACADTYGDGASACTDGPSCIGRQATSCSDGPTCGDEATACNDGPTCDSEESGIQTACSDGPSCEGYGGDGPVSPDQRRPQGGGYSTRHFSPEIVAQLRQQLETHIGN